MLPSSLLASIFLLATSTYADDGLYHPSQYGGAAVATLTPTVQTMPLDTTAATPSMPAVKNSGAVASQALTTAVAATGTGGWESQVTWPAGCESWANPCPSGAKISGGGVAGYTNGFTSYTTETDSNGVITGMPAVATVGAGVSVASNASTTLSTITESVRTLSTTTRNPSSTQSGFVVQSATSNGAGSLAVFGSSSLVVVAAAFALFC